MSEEKLNKAGLKVVGLIPDELYEEVSRRLNYPRIPKHPVFVKGNAGPSTAYFDFASGEIAIFDSFIDTLVDKGVKEDDAVVGVCLHEFGHYTGFPVTSWMFETVRWRLNALKFNSYRNVIWDKLQKSFGFKKDIDDLKPHEKRALDKLAKQRVNTVLNYYLDLIDNVNLMCHKRNVELRELYRVLHNPDDGESIDNFMIEVYDFFSAHSLNLEYKVFDEDRVKELNSKKVFLGLGADYLKRQIDVLVFADIIEPLLKDEFSKDAGGGSGSGGDFIELPNQDGDESDSGAGQGSVMKGGGVPDLENIELLPEGFGDIHENNMDNKQKAKTLEDIAQNCGRGRYKVLRDFISPDKPNVVQPPKKIFGIGGPDEGDVDIPKVSQYVIDFYMSRARKFPTFEFSVPLFVNKEDEFPIGFKEWEDDVYKLDIVESRGLIIPDYSQEHRLVPRKKKSKGFDAPSAVILVDSSGSMPDPSGVNPCSLAALGAVVVAENYLRNDRSVGVLNFSGSSLVLLPTKNKHNIYYASVMYQGGGTVVNLLKLYDLVKEMDSITPDELSQMSDSEIARRFSPEVVEKSKEKRVVVPSADLSVYENTDLWLFSDMGILNINELFDLASVDKRRRLFFVETYGGLGDISPPENVFYTNLSSEKDVYNVINLLKRGFGLRSGQSRASGLSYFKKKNGP